MSNFPGESMTHIVHDQIEPALAEMGLRQNREKWYLDDAGHRGFSVDVGTSHDEILLRVTDNGILTERIAVLKPEKVSDALDVVALVVAAKKQEVTA